MIRLVWQELERTYLLTLDAVLSEQYDIAAAVTVHPIEHGSPLTDHVRAEPIKITLDGVVTNTPLYLPPDHTDGMVSTNHMIEARGQTLADAIERSKFTPGLGQSPVEAQIAAVAASQIRLPGRQGYVRTNIGNRERLVVDTLIRLRDKAIQLTCESGLRRWSNLVLASSTVRREANKQLRISLSLQEVQGAVVTALEVVPQVSTTRVQKPRTQPAETPTEEPPQSSTLFRGLDALGVFQ